MCCHVSWLFEGFKLCNVLVNLVHMNWWVININEFSPGDIGVKELHGYELLEQYGSKKGSQGECLFQCWS